MNFALSSWTHILKAAIALYTFKIGLIIHVGQSYAFSSLGTLASTLNSIRSYEELISGSHPHWQQLEQDLL